jgi:integrase
MEYGEISTVVVFDLRDPEAAGRFHRERAAWRKQSRVEMLDENHAVLIIRAGVPEDDDQGLVFTSEAGTPINPSNLRERSFAPLLKEAALPHIRFHDLRHTCATLLLSKGVHPKFVQELLGHATIAITLDTYSHVLPSMGDQTARVMQDVLSPMEGVLTD